MTVMDAADQLPARALEDAERAVERCYWAGATGVDELAAIVEAVEPHCRLAELTWLADAMRRVLREASPEARRALSGVLAELSARIVSLTEANRRPVC